MGLLALWVCKEVYKLDIMFTRAIGRVMGRTMGIAMGRTPDKFKNFYRGQGLDSIWRAQVATTNHDSNVLF